MQARQYAHAESVRVSRLYGLIVRSPLLISPRRRELRYFKLPILCEDRTRTYTSLVVRALART